MRALLCKYKTYFNPAQILYEIHVKSRYVIKDFCYRIILHSIQKFRKPLAKFVAPVLRNLLQEKLNNLDGTDNIAVSKRIEPPCRA